MRACAEWPVSLGEGTRGGTGRGKGSRVAEVGWGVGKMLGSEVYGMR